MRIHETSVTEFVAFYGIKGKDNPAIIKRLASMLKDKGDSAGTFDAVHLPKVLGTIDRVGQFNAMLDRRSGRRPYMRN